MHPYVCIAVSGPKNSGKTHLLEELIQLLATSGQPFAVVKHDAHAHMDVDRPGKDTWRFGEAGARRVAVLGPRGAVRFDYGAAFEPGDSVDVLASLFPGVGLVVAEGFKDHRLPRIKLIGQRDRPAERMALSQAPVTDEAMDVDSAVPISAEECLRFIDGLRLAGLAASGTTQERPFER